MKDICWLGLSQVPGFGPRSLKQLLQEFSSVEELWTCSAELLRQTAISQAQIETFLQFRKNFDPHRETALLLENGIYFIHLDHPDYPERLTWLYDPPLVLYYRGDITILKDETIGVVGSRRATAYGAKVAYNLASDLASSGLVIVSGMARGIDTAAHKGALGAQGKTVAVLGSGVDICYPKQNKEIYQEICTKGLVISEFPPNTPPEARNFPIRNRVISGLSSGVVVVEAAEKSGSLITADLALEQGKDVFAVPGPVNSANSVGTNRLLKQGALLVEDADDVLNQLGFSSGLWKNNAPGKKGVLLTAEEEEIISLLCGGPIHLEQLAGDIGHSMERLQSLLLFLEVKGLVKKLPGSYYQAI
ncbi:DNA-processing protein DprA [Metallumcola ferriviriculae]|uniref:DNA-processing protein DprA n=1 Tax=Metallumcola ferriviriculae TaxID=3039180 RepID=A0AAU0UN73_9FIRM|nr:DNA-processing protein DprA [Desulfitibacteraceae bacterium MK1]